MLGMTTSKYERQVFINCPFDKQYNKMFEAITFAVSDCGFRPRSAREAADSAQVRIDKIFSIIESCKFGIHDLSRTEIDPTTKLPRFNMPLELGIFLGAKRYGKGRQGLKVGLIFDRPSYDYQKYISDISGQDIEAHEGSPSKAIAKVRNWLLTASPGYRIPGGGTIAKRFTAFNQALPAICETLKLSRKSLIFADLIWAISNWLESNPW